MTPETDRDDMAGIEGGGSHRTLMDRLARAGSIRFDEYVELALYAPGEGFFAAGGGAGRGGSDFLTSPEVGPLFGQLVAEYLDRRWERLGCPDPFVVVEAAAGRGALAMSVLAAAPRCRSALRYVLVERSEELRHRQHQHLALSDPDVVLASPVRSDDPWAPASRGIGPLLCSVDELPRNPVVGVVLANELLDNLPFRLVERQLGGWHEVRVSRVGTELLELSVPVDEATGARLAMLAPDALPGARLALQDAAADWLRRALSLVEVGTVLAIDYTTHSHTMMGRPQTDWLRTYRAHDRGVGPLADPGRQDITVEVAIDQLAVVRPPTRRSSQAGWLFGLGLEALVEEGRRIWAEQAASPGLDAMRARSRIAEAAALADPEGLGSFEVMEWDLP